MGPYRFPAILLKQCCTKSLYVIWRKFLDLGHIPQIPKTVYIIPIHMGGIRGVAKNNRPIVLTSQLIKVFAKVIRKKILEHTETHNLSGTDALNNLLHLDFVGFTQWQLINLGGSWDLRKIMRHTINKYFVWQWDQCYWKQMLLSSRSNIYVVSLINNSNSSFFTSDAIADMILIVITSFV